MRSTAESVEQSQCPTRKGVVVVRQVVMAPGMGVKAVSLPSLFPNAAGGNVHLGYPSEARLQKGEIAGFQRPQAENGRISAVWCYL